MESDPIGSERPDTLYLKFEMRLPCDDTSDSAREGGVLTVRGDGTYKPDDSSFGKLRNFGSTLYFNLHGAPQTLTNTVWGVGSAVVGHKEISHTVCYELGK